MSIHLQDSIPKTDLTMPLIPGAQLARWIERAVRTHYAARKLKGYELDAIIQDVAIAVLRADRSPETVHGSPADVLAYIARCERMPAMMAHSGDALHIATLAAHDRAKYLQRAVSTQLERGAWRDHSGRFQSAESRQRGTGPMVEPIADLSIVDIMASSVHASVGSDDLEVASADLSDLCATVVGLLADDWTPTMVANATAALIRAATVATNADPALALADLAQAEGKTLHAVQCAASRGAATLTTVSAATLVSAIREASALMPSRSAVPDKLSYSKGRMPAEARTYADVIADIARSGGSWDAGSIRTGRSLPAWADRMVKIHGPVNQRWVENATPVCG